MTGRGQPHILLLQLEFPLWEQARAWTYPACYGVVEGLQAAGAICTTIPLLASAPYSADAWLAHARHAVAGKQFDQVWVWLVHSLLTPSVLDWISTLAPVRVGIVMESLTYDEADYAWAEHLRSRLDLVVSQSQALTHVLVSDETDVDHLRSRAGIRTLWWPTMVPARFIVPASGLPRHRTGVFHGQPYGPRQGWIAHQSLAGRLEFRGSCKPATYYQQLFDQLQNVILRRFAGKELMTPAQMENYQATLEEIRLGEFNEWMGQLQQWAAIVNLPSLAKFYGGRVYEGMAAGRPVLTYSIPQHTRNNKLFIEGQEVVLFSQDSPESLAECLDRVLRDDSFAGKIVVNAQRKLRRYHTSEYRLAQTLSWIESGSLPDYGDNEVAGQGASISFTNAQNHVQADGSVSANTVSLPPSTTVFILSVEDPVFPSCKAAVEAQVGTAFKLEVIRNVCPFSAAAQKMIMNCSTEFFIQVDEDMILNQDAVATMESVMRCAPDDVGMVCFHLYDDDRKMNIQGIKVYRTALMKDFLFQDVKASEMDLLEQMGRRGIKWILHPDLKGRHGTLYTPETIYRRYKSMYEKDIRQWNVLTADIHRKAEAYRETGDPLQFFALLGAVHGIINAPLAANREKDAHAYDLVELDVFKRLFLSDPPLRQPYAVERQAPPPTHRPILFEHVQWKGERDRNRMPRVADCVTKRENGSRTKSVLIVTPHFWPSIGGVERVVEELGVGLMDHGYHVDVATYPKTERLTTTHRGLAIITLSPHDCQVGSVPACALEVEQLIVSGQYDACVMLGAPVNSLFYGAMTCLLPDRTRLIFQPTMNKEIYDMLSGMSAASELAVRLAVRAEHVVVLSEGGHDASFFKHHGVRTFYLPNGTQVVQSSVDFRREYGISHETFVILHVANLYPVKNHVGLLDVFAQVPVGAKLVLIGYPTNETEYVAQVRRALTGMPEVLYIPGLSSEGVAMAMRAADVLVVPSYAEASPLCILEAMSHGLPWMATPECDAAHEQAGGVVIPLVDFRRAVTLLMREPALRRALGETGHAHWEACHQWSAVLEGWIELIETGHLTRSYRMSPDLVERMTAQRQAFATGLERVEPECSGTTSTGSRASTSEVTRQTNGGAMNSDAFYVNLFVNAPAWSTPHPNADESSRWSKIAAFLEYILRRVRQSDPNKRLRILDIGCGRGWLTNLATMYGTCEGIEPVAGVVEHARKLFPHLRFEAGTAESVLSRSDFVPYDVVLTSEVIEHVPHGQKADFFAQVARLLTPDGYVVLTTPRGEMWEQWSAIAPPNQPVEDWVTEDQLRTLFVSQGFSELGLERVHVEPSSFRYIPAPTPADLRSMHLLPIYQVWVCQRTVDQAPVPFTRAPKVSVIVPTYNRPDRLRTALASLAAQTFQDFEVIVVNDAGCEIGFVVAACPDRHRITTISHDRNRGLGATRNSGLRAAKGTYIAYLDDDDRYLPQHLETLVTYLERHDCQVAYTDAWRVHERQVNGEYVETGRDVPYSYEYSPADLLVSNYFPVLCVMHARQCLDEVGLFDESLFAHEDWDLWIRIATRFQLKHLAVTTAEFSWRSDGTSMTSGTSETYRRTIEIIYRKYAPHAEQIVGIRERQQEHLAKLRAQVRAKSYACSIIIPVWNCLNLTRGCLMALSQIKDQPEYEVIVVDNGSTDGTRDFLHTLGGDVQIICNDHNLGFAKACNQGARAARGKYFVFLNNDTIPQPGWLNALVEEAEDDGSVGVVGSKLLYEDGTIQHAGVVRDCEGFLPYHIYKSFAGDHPAVNQRREFQIVTAACLLIRRSLFEEVGGFDEGYLNGFEDVDLCLKVRERGYRVVYQPRSVVVHLESQTPGRKTHDDTNVARFLDRWGAQWWAGDEDLHFYVDGYKLRRTCHNGQLGGDIQLIGDIKDRASWAHVAAAQSAALKQDWPAVRRELILSNDWPGDPYVLFWGAMVAQRLQEPVYRAQFLIRYLALVDAPAERLELIRMLLEQNNLPGVEEHLCILLNAAPDHAEGLMLKGILGMQREQYKQAEMAFDSAMREGADRKKCLMGMGMAAMGRAYTQGAWERFLQVLAEYPDDAEAIHWLLRAGTAQNRWQELGEHLRRYVRRNPGDLAARFAFASVLLRGEQIEEARREYDALRQVAPGHDGLDQLGQAITGREAALAFEAASS